MNWSEFFRAIDAGAVPPVCLFTGPEVYVKREALDRLRSKLPPGLEDWIRNMDRIVQKYGSHSVYFFLPEMSYDEGMTLLDYAEKHWKDIPGTFCESLRKG